MALAWSVKVRGWNEVSIIDRILRKRQQFDIEDDLRNASRSIPRQYILAATGDNCNINAYTTFQLLRNNDELSYNLESAYFWVVPEGSL